MEVKLFRCQSLQVTAFNETLRLGSIIELGEMWQTSMLETEWNSLTFDVLLADTSQNLTQIFLLTLRTCINHMKNVISVGDLLKKLVASLISRVIKLKIDQLFERFHQTFTGLELQITSLQFGNHFIDSKLGDFQSSSNLVESLIISNGITNTDSMTMIDEPIVDDLLNISQEISCSHETTFKPNGMDKTLSGGTYSLVIKDTLQMLTLINQNVSIVEGSIFFEGTVGFGFKTDLGKNHGNNLFTSPKLLRLHDGRLGEIEFTIPELGRNSHDQTHDIIDLQEEGSSTKVSDTSKGILFETHDGLIGLW
mmetsp:Transcript_9050/g.7963  ORF Transcript_9050/g.7963 Transcript_9050/m.7963 type:complete len:309 (+) Transcript_9050:2831-3757(+)